MISRLAPLLLFAATAWAGIDGKVVNGTSGQPQPDTLVSLLQPGAGGMQTLASTKSDASGNFHFDRDPKGPRILQAIYNGVIYNQVAPPNASAASFTVTVYEPVKDPIAAPMTQHLVLLQPGDTELAVSEEFLFADAGKTTFNDPANGSARVWIPEAGRASAKVTVTAPGGMPIQRDPAKTREPGVYKIDYPLKPGETRFEVNYTLPVTQPATFDGKTVGATSPLQLVVPAGVTLKGDSVELLGQEPTTQAGIYSVKAAEYRVEIDGTGTIAPPQTPSGENSGMPQIVEGPPRIYSRMWWILGLCFLILGIGASLLYRRRDPAGRA